MGLARPAACLPTRRSNRAIQPHLDPALQLLQQVITDTHQLIVHEPDPALKTMFTQCLQQFMKAQQQKLAGQQQTSSAVQQVLQSLGGR